MVPIKYSSTASSVQKFTDTSISPGLHVNCSVNGKSGAVSLSRMKLMSNRPELVAQRDASTSTRAVHTRCNDRICENRTSLTLTMGLHALSPRACVAPHIARRPVSAAQSGDRKRGAAPSGFATFLGLIVLPLHGWSLMQGTNKGIARGGAKHPFSRLTKFFS
jgi:hypothetical protein